MRRVSFYRLKHERLCALNKLKLPIHALVNCTYLYLTETGVGKGSNWRNLVPKLSYVKVIDMNGKFSKS